MRSITALSSAVAIACLATAAFAEGQQQRFDDPRTPQGHYVDRCLQWAHQCDDNSHKVAKPASHEFCRRMCYANAIDGHWSFKAPTQILMGGQFCNDARVCGGLDFVVCTIKLRPCPQDGWVRE
jgi:hypothetical protein